MALPAENVHEIHMPLSVWDREVSPHLQFIESGSQMAARHARMLAGKPAFLTMAEHELEQARSVLAAALERIEQAQTEYQNKEAVS
jgi:hypothetical protein